MNFDLNGPKVIGLKQTVKAITDGSAKKVYLAEDADAPIKEEITDLCERRGVPLELVQSKGSLGKACGIECSASVTALL